MKKPVPQKQKIIVASKQGSFITQPTTSAALVRKTTIVEKPQEVEDEENFDDYAGAT